MKRYEEEEEERRSPPIPFGLGNLIGGKALISAQAQERASEIGLSRFGLLARLG